jgi:DNA-binding response OmpR family regulator
MKRVLAVDDEPGILQTFSEALTTKGYEVVTTDQAVGAPELLRSGRFDLILLDLQMPGKNGFELYREFTSTREVPILFVSGFADRFSPTSPEFAELWIGQFSFGRTDILYKPFTLSSLLEKVEQLIGSGEVTAHGIR